MSATARRPSPVVDALFFATLFTVTFAKLQWEVAGTLSLSDVLTALFLVAVAGSRLGTGDRRIAYGAAVAAAFFLAFLLVYLVGFFNLETEQALEQWAKGMVKFVLHFLFLVAGISYLARRVGALLLALARRLHGRVRRERGLRDRPARRRRGRGREPRPVRRCSRSRAARARSTSTARSAGRASTGRTRSPATRTTSGSS